MLLRPITDSLKLKSMNATDLIYLYHGTTFLGKSNNVRLHAE